MSKQRKHDPADVRAQALREVGAIQNREELFAAVLRQVNVIRNTVGLVALPQLQRGRQNEACECPIARSLSGVGTLGRIRAIASYDHIILSGDRPRVATTPGDVRLFMLAFDRGLLKQYKS